MGLNTLEDYLRWGDDLFEKKKVEKPINGPLNFSVKLPHLMKHPLNTCSIH